MHRWQTRAVVTFLVAGAVTCLVSACLRPADPAAGTPTDAPASRSTGSRTSTPGARGTDLAATGTWAGFTAPAAQWEAWEPVMAGIRPATEGDVVALVARARTVLERSFTVTALGGLGEYEMSWSPTHARVLFGIGSDTYLEAHSTAPAKAPLDRDALLRGPLTVCLHQESRCTTITGDEDTGDRPHLFDTMTDSLVYQASASTTAQAMAPALLEEIRGPGRTVGLTAVASPLGQLDCVVVVENAAALAPLEGTSLEPGESDPDRSALCLDARGLVVVSPGGSFQPVTAYTSMRPEVAPGFDAIPFAVQPVS